MDVTQFPLKLCDWHLLARSLSLVSFHAYPRRLQMIIVTDKRAFFFPSLFLSIKTKQTLPTGHLYLFFWVKLLALQKYNRLEGPSLLFGWRWWHWHEVIWQGIKMEKYWWQSVRKKRISLKKGIRCKPQKVDLLLGFFFGC